MRFSCRFKAHERFFDVVLPSVLTRERVRNARRVIVVLVLHSTKGEARSKELA